MRVPAGRLAQVPENGPIYNGRDLVAFARIGGPSVPLSHGPDDTAAGSMGFGSWHPGIFPFVLERRVRCGQLHRHDYASLLHAPIRPRGRGRRAAGMDPRGNLAVPRLSVSQMAAAAALLAAAGCGPDRIATYPVSGIVVFEDGQRVASGVVEFRTSGSVPIARGQLGADARFTLGTFEAADGAAAGQHQVIVVQHASIESAVNDPEQAREQRAHKSSLIDPAFASYEKSGLKADVEPDAVNRFTPVVRRFTAGSGKVVLGRFDWVEQRGHDDDRLRPESRLIHSKARFSNRHILRQRLIG